MARRSPSRRRTKAILAVARERMDYLFELAHQEAGRKEAGDLELAHRAVRLARLIGMRYNLRLSPEQKLRQCRHCYAFLWPGRTARVRLRRGKLTVHCQLCGKQNRRPYEPEKVSIISNGD